MAASPQGRPGGQGGGAAAPSILDSVTQSILASAGSIEDIIDAESLIKRLAAEEKPSSRAGQRALSELKDFARRSPGVLVASSGALQEILRAVEKLTPADEGEEDFDAVEPLQDTLELLSGLVGEKSSDEETNRRGAEVAEMILRCSENGKGILKLLNAKDVSTEYDAMILLQRIYHRLPAPIDAALLADPLSLGRLMQTMQSCHIDYVRNEALGMLILLTQSNKDIQTIVTVQGLVETVFAILEEEELAAGGKLSRDLIRCLTNLMGNPTCQKYIRESTGVSSLITAITIAVTGKRPGEEAEEEEDDGFGPNRHADIPEESRWLCLSLLVDAALAFAGRGSEGSSEALANQDKLVRAGALALCKHLKGPVVATVAKLKIVELLEALLLNKLAAQTLQTYGRDRSPPLLFVVVDVLLGATTPLPLRNALGRVVGRAVVQHATLQSFICSSLSPQLSFEPEEREVIAPAGRCIVETLEDAAAGRPEAGRLWFALHLAMAMLFGNRDVQSACVSMPVIVPRDAGPAVTFLELVLKAFSACIRACDAAPEKKEGEIGDSDEPPAEHEKAPASLIAILKLMLYWMASCPAALAPFARSPVTVPLVVELAAAAEMGDELAFFQLHIEGLSSLLLGLCIEADDADVDVGAIMALIAQRVGIEEFQQKVERLWRSEALQRPPRQIAKFRWYGSRFRAFIRERQRTVQRRMVQLYVAGSVGTGGAALSEDVADHYKQLIRVQDEELREVRKENEHLRGEVEAFMRKALQAKSAAMVEKMDALELENDALHTEVAQLLKETEDRDAAYERERGELRGAVVSLEQQLEAMAVGYEQVERTSEALARENEELRGKLGNGGVSKAAAKDADSSPEASAAMANRVTEELRSERDDLLELLGRISAECPEAVAKFAAPLGKLALEVETHVVQEVSGSSAAVASA
eukprot:TRINITY_DN52942_c0_g1_i1.p1 TRINITY_DN52942_c0_g1~~TRINITY_DN52942_c0_g1_i1.p1  ORF type:complete len:930 (+),score=251.88 TRINITY_DN52942_c0_g1_i1:120-2909(+)